MKRIIIIAAAMLMAVTASAKGWGVTAGMNFNSAKIKEIKMDAQAGWNVGVTYAFDLPLGFSIQPSLVYTQKGALLERSLAEGSLIEDLTTVKLNQTVGSLNLPVSVQWGPDLIVARPFIDVTPYIGYSLMNKAKGEVAGVQTEEKGKNAFDYGLGIGAGVNVWKLQAIVRYNWNFGALGSFKDFTDIDLGDLNPEDQTYGGISIHLAYFF